VRCVGPRIPTSAAVSHLYHHRDVFLRELTSNAGDAIEKTRLLALTDASILDAAPQLNISIQAFPDENKLVIADSGIGMTRDELAKNLGTIARSGTSEFLSKIENASSDNKGSNLIGQFGLGELRAVMGSAA
jgi:heat shock protein beta